MRSKWPPSAPDYDRPDPDIPWYVHADKPVIISNDVPPVFERRVEPAIHDTSESTHN